MLYGGFQKASGVVTGVGYMYDKDEVEESNTTDRTLTAYVMMYLLEGGGIFDSPAATRQRVSAGDVILLFPGVPHTYGRAGESPTWSECWVEFNGSMFEALEKDGVIRKERPVLSPGLLPPLIAGFDELIRNYQSAVPGEETEFAAQALLLLARVIAADRRRHESEGEREFVIEACARLQAHLDGKLDMAKVARSMGMSERAFRRRFVAGTGVAPARYRLLQRIAAARMMLTSSTIPVGTIAERLGYCDVHFFIKQFREHTGLTPGRFRQKEVEASDPNVRDHGDLPAHSQDTDP
jgi:AraC-like DNA-binding protein